MESQGIGGLSVLWSTRCGDPQTGRVAPTDPSLRDVQKSAVLATAELLNRTLRVQASVRGPEFEVKWKDRAS